MISSVTRAAAGFALAFALTLPHGVLAQDPTHVEVTAAAANVRRGPGTQHPILLSVRSGMVLEIVEPQRQQWFAVRLAPGLGTTATMGFIHASLVKAHIPARPPAEPPEQRPVLVVEPTIPPTISPDPLSLSRTSPESAGVRTFSAILLTRPINGVSLELSLGGGLQMLLGGGPGQLDFLVESLAIVSRSTDDYGSSTTLELQVPLLFRPDMSSQGGFAYLLFGPAIVVTPYGRSQWFSSVGRRSQWFSSVGTGFLIGVGADLGRGPRPLSLEGRMNVDGLWYDRGRGVDLSLRRTTVMLLLGVPVGDSARR
jgi:hypothetical protein